MKYSYAILSILATISLLGCKKEEDVHNQWQKTMAVEALLIVDEPVDNISLTRLENSSYQEFDHSAITDANVELITADTTYTISYNAASGKYGNPAAIVQPQTNYTLKVYYEDKTLVGETETPGQVEIYEGVPDTVYINPVSYVEDLFDLTWNSMPGFSFVLSLENLEANPIEIPFPEQEGGQFDEEFSTPTEQNKATISDYHFEHYGMHVIYVYSIHPKYNEVYQHGAIASQDVLLQGPSNIQNGYGFITSMSRDQVMINVLE